MKKNNFREKRTRILGFACLAVAVASGISSCRDYDLDKRTPEWLGTSIYETLEEGFVSEDGKDYTGKFTTFVRLIDDLDYTNVLAKTGSKTLFVADDDAFERFYAKGIFRKADGSPVRNYDELSLAQKKMLMNGAMLNNVYQVAMLSSSQGPTIGDCMRRISSISIYDSVPVMKPSEMPTTKHWKYYRNQDHGFAVLQDGTNKPMVMFVNKFLTAKKITDDDYDFLFNQGVYDPTGQKPGRKSKDASVNGVRIETQNKKCFNGFIHVMEDVIYSLPNMAEYIATTDKSKVFSSIMDRYSAPYYSAAHTDEIKRLKSIGALNIADEAIDSVFQKQYFSQRSQGNSTVSTTPDRQVVAKDNLLKFDPGWNTYYSSTSSTTTANVALQQNMGVILVPTDDILLSWWVSGGGKALKQRYGRLAGNPTNAEELIYDMDSVPDNVIIKLLNNNMLNSLVGSVPSKFKNVLNDANDPMGIEPDHVTDVEMCCNGAVYFTKVVFSPTAYRSVSYPVLVNEKLKIFNWAINELEFDAYLNSMVATYSFFVPESSDNGSTDEKLQNKMIYIDPVSYGQAYLNGGLLRAFVFEYDDRQKTVQARIYPYDPKTGTIDVSGTGSTASSDQIRDRLEDILDYHVIIGDVEEIDPETGTSYNYFQTKGRGTIYFDWNPADKNAGEGQTLLSKVKGSYQVETERIDTLETQTITIKTRYNQASLKKDPTSTTDGNGRTYVIDKPLLTARLSLYDILSDEVNYPEFHEFFELMSHAGVNNVGLFSQNMNKHATGSMNLTTLNTYHYTVYVPTEKALKDLYKSGRLFTIGMIDSIKTTYDENIDDVETNKTSYDKIWNMFENYHQFVQGTADDFEVTDSVFRNTPWFSKYTAKLEKQITDFVKYHIQDNSVYVNGKFTIDLRENPLGEANYETAYMNDNAQFVKLSVKYDHARNKIFVIDTETDKALRANPAYVSAPTDEKIKMREAAAKIVDPAKAVSVSGKPLYNIMCREYEYDNASVGSATQIETSSYVVIHLIDGTLNNGDF
ncbi:MAG: hypothetical protein J6T18_01090 [Bacteroidaceae bacterium]|nr:hypothetical protein [Bacteroidaceae bacterium]